MPPLGRPPDAASTSAAAGSREGWIDLAKGGAILLVVLLHAQEVLIGNGLGTPAWDTITEALGTLRMPTFFLISGLFARKALTAPLRGFLRSKVWHFLWVYLLWSALYVALFEGIGAVNPGGAFEGMALKWAIDTVIVNNGLWYLVALPVFFLLARWTRRVPVAVQLSVTGVVSLVFASGLIATGTWGADHMPAYFVYFLVGCHFGPVIRSTAVRAGVVVALGIGVLWVTLTALAYTVGWQGAAAAVLPLLAVPFALSAAPLIAGRRWGGPLVWLGRNTLPVYVMHYAPVVLIVLVLKRVGALSDGSPLRWVLPVALAAVTTGVTLLMRLAVVRWAPVLFRLPHRMSAAPGAGPSAVPAVTVMPPQPAPPLG
jgi:uncharacterized membrane protein YcfT